MKFNTVAEAYGFYRNASVSTMEARAQAINADIAANADADISAYNIELEGIEQAMSEKRGENQPANRNAGDLGRTAGDEGDQADAASKLYRTAFYKHLIGKGLTEAERRAFEQVNGGEKRASAFNKLSDSAAVIPTQTLNEIITKARAQGGIMGISRGFNMPANIAIPVATPGAAASWHVEGAPVDTEKVEPVSVTFGANEILRVISISAAVRTMSIDAFESYIADELTESVMACIGTAMVSGTGSGQGKGIVSGITWTNGTNQVTVAANASLTYANIVAAIAMLKRGYANGAKFVMNNATLYNSIYGLVDDVKRPVFVADPTEAGKGRILGFEVVIDDFMADNDILFGDFRYNGYNIAEGIALDVSRESSFKSGLIDYRALAVADCKPIVDEAFVRITKASA